LLVWLTLLLGASRSTILAQRKAAVAVIVFAVAASAALLDAANTVLRPISRNIAAVEAEPVTLAKQVGFIMEDPRQPNGSPNAPSWNPYYWAAIHVVRHNDAILANAPWMDETILPVGPGPALPEETIPVLKTPVPSHLYGELINAPQRLRAMNTVNFVVVQQHPGSTPSVATDPMPALERDLQGSWSCQEGPANWYRLCRRQ
jgi:hypothetical protein